MVDTPITCNLFSQSVSIPRPVRRRTKASETGPLWIDDKSCKSCKSCGFQFNVLIRKHHCRLCGKIFCRYCAEVCSLCTPPPPATLREHPQGANSSFGFQFHDSHI